MGAPYGLPLIFYELMLQWPLRALVVRRGSGCGSLRDRRAFSSQSKHDSASPSQSSSWTYWADAYSRRETGGQRSRTGWHQIGPRIFLGGRALRTPCCNRKLSSICASRLSPITFKAHVKPRCTPH